MLKFRCDPELVDIYYATKDSAGFDLLAAETTLLPPGGVYLMRTGLFIEDYRCREATYFGFKIKPELQIRSRSGLALRHGVVVLNSPGTVDADYEGEIQVILKNTSSTNEYLIQRGDRIAQAVCNLILQIPQFLKINPLSRRDGGFGSTGV